MKECRTLKDVLKERMIQPFTPDNPDSFCTVPKFGAAYSAILFGPPGRAKVSVLNFLCIFSLCCCHSFRRY